MQTNRMYIFTSSIAIAVGVIVAAGCGGKKNDANNNNSVNPDGGGIPAAHLVGYVHDGETEAPLADARVTVQGVETEVFTDTDGKFALPVAEAGLHVITAQADGYSYGIRRVRSTPTHVKAVPPIYLAPLDPVVTEISAEGGTHVNSDESVELEFPAGSLGSTAQVRSTRYQTGKVLPAKLPPQTRVTTAVDVDLDGANLSGKATIRVRNDLGFAPGTEVPVGALNRETGLWEADGMGTVTADGEFLEYETEHFSAFDLNFPAVVDGHPADPEATVGHVSEPDECGGSAVGLASGNLTITHETPPYRSLSVGRAVGLVYRSESVRPGADLQLRNRVPRDGSGNPVGLSPEKVEIVVDIEGRYEQFFFQGSAEDSAFAYRWDGINGLGESVPTGLYPAQLKIVRYFDEAEYAAAICFGCPPLESLGTPTAELVPIPAETTVPVAIEDRRESAVGAGWGVLGLHRLRLDPGGRYAMVSRGGQPPRTYQLSARGVRIAGTGEQDAFDPLIPSGTPAREVDLYEPRAVAVDDTGAVYFSTYYKGVYKIDNAGAIQHVAGTDTRGYSGDGGPATAAALDLPTALAWGTAGDLYIADEGNDVIRRVDDSGIIETVAGDGADGWGLSAGEGDGELATTVSLYEPRGVTVDAAGTLYFADSHDCLWAVGADGLLSLLTCEINDPRGIAVSETGVVYTANDDAVYSVAPDGAITPFATPPRPGFSPADVAIAGPQSVYVLDAGRNQVCRLGADGSYQLVAGVESNQPHEGLSLSGDGGPVTEIPLDLTNEASFAQDPDGNLVVADVYHNVLWRLGLQPAADGAAVYRAEADDPQTLERNADGTHRLWLGSSRYVTFDTEGRQVERVDTDGHATSYAYDSEGRLVTITDPVGKVTSLSYDGDGFLESITDPAGRQTALSHDADGNLVQITDPAGRQTAYAYDGHRLTRKTEPTGEQTEYLYEDGRVTRVNLPTGEVRRYQRPPLPGDAGEIAPGQGSEDQPAASPTTLERDVVLIDGDGNESIVGFGLGGRVTRREDALGRVTTIERDRYGHAVAIHRPDGIVNRRTFGARTYRLRNVVRSMNHSNVDGFDVAREVCFHYDEALGKVIRVVAPGHVWLVDAIHDLTYDEDGHLTASEDPLGQVTAFENNAQGQPTRITTPSGRTSTLTYNDSGNVTSMTDSAGNSITLSYDDAGDLTGVEDPLGRVVILERDALGRTTAVVDPAGRRVEYGYDNACGSCGSAGQPTQITDPLGRTTSYQYDGVGNLVQITNSEGQTRQYSYDLARRLVSITDVDGSVTALTRDAAGRVTVMEDGDGRATSMTYDDGDRLLSVEDDQARLAYQYDEYGYLSRITRVAAGQSLTWDVVTSQWNGLITEVTDPQGRTMSYNYTDRLRPRQAFLDSSSDPDSVFWFAYQYDEDGRLLSRDMHDSTGASDYQTTYGYDTAGRLASITHTNRQVGALWSTQITRDAAGRPTQLDGTHGLVQPAYDDSDRLTGVTYGGASTLGDETFSYDAVGNQTGGGRSYGALDRLLEDTDHTFTYDARGRMLTRTHKATGEQLVLEWNDRDQLVGAERFDGSATLQMSATYAYDPKGRRIAKTVDGVTTRTAWSGSSPVATYDDAGNLLTRWFRCPVTGELIGVWSGSYRGFVLNDQRGTPRAVAGYAGPSPLGWEAEYPAYGEAQVVTGATVDNPHRFPGQLRDPETGLHYNVYRYYDPRSGRYLSPDPIWTPQDSRYAYAASNPLMHVDPLGLWPSGSEPAGDYDASYDTYTDIAANAKTGLPHVGAVPDAISSAAKKIYGMGWYGVFDCVTFDTSQKDPEWLNALKVFASLPSYLVVGTLMAVWEVFTPFTFFYALGEGFNDLDFKKIEVTIGTSPNHVKCHKPKKCELRSE